MILHRLVAFPESRRILRLHISAQVFLAVQVGMFTMVPVLLRGRFAASEWQTLIATASQAIMSALAIFWNELYGKSSPGRYLLLLWCFAALPLAGIAGCSSAGPVLLFVLLSAAGLGGVQPVNGDLLRSCYPPSTRNRVWSLLKVIEQLMVIATAFCFGRWLDRSADAHRWAFPLTVMLVGCGMLLIHRITRHTLYRERLADRTAAPRASGIWSAYGNMARVLREDPDFRRYEMAFFVYGMGWMICYSMLPFVVIDVLHLTYEQAAIATQVVFQAAMLTMLMPVAHLMDRLGPIRACAWGFSFLIVYPVLLMSATGVPMLATASIIYGLGMAVVNLAWTVGPVSLARNASQAAHYLAIHATLVAVRSILGQLPAVAIYRYTHEWLGPAQAVRIPLMLAALMFVGGTILMWRLNRDRRGRIPVPPPKAPISQPAEVTAGTES